MTYNLFSTTPNSLKFGKYIQKNYFIFGQDFGSSDGDHKEFSLSKEMDFKTEAETLDTWISLST
jgi:hypothetical protein